MNWPDWTGEPAVIVASGPTAADAPLEMARGRAKVLAVKDAWRLCPWADILYACDHHWWREHKGAVRYEGQRIAYDPRTLEQWRGLEMLKIDLQYGVKNLRFERTGLVGAGGNSGFHALNLALQFGSRDIALVGFDMRVDRGLHFFGAHAYSKAPNKQNCANWAKHFDNQAPKLAEIGARVINCSPVSAIGAYPKMTLEEALDEICMDRV